MFGSYVSLILKNKKIKKIKKNCIFDVNQQTEVIHMLVANYIMNNNIYLGNESNSNPNQV